MNRHSHPRTVFRRTALASLLSVGLTAYGHASIVRSDVDYQYFRDFAENKGQFAVGVSNVTVYKKDGSEAGVMLKDVPMIDFSVIERNNGVAALIEPQYLSSVQQQ